MTTSDQQKINVIELVQRDHREIERMLAAVEDAPANMRQQPFEELVHKLAVHETAEEIVVHPATKKAGGTDVVGRVLSEEDTAKKALAGLDGMDVSSSDFANKFASLKRDVLAHAEREEAEEHPLLAQHESDADLARMGRLFEQAEKTAPTHPHANAPESRVGNLVLGPILAVSDRVRVRALAFRRPRLMGMLALCARSQRRRYQFSNGRKLDESCCMEGTARGRGRAGRRRVDRRTHRRSVARRGDTGEKMPGVMCAIDAVGYEAWDRDAPGERQRPSQVFEDLVRVTNPTGHISLIGVYFPEDPGGVDDDAKQGRFTLPLGELWNKGISVEMGQAPVKRYNEYLRDLIIAGLARPSFIVSHDLPLEAAPEAYEKFDKRADGYTKVLLKPRSHAA